MKNYSKEHDNIRVPYSLHGVALAQEIPETDIPILNLELLDHNGYLPPSGSVDDPVASFIDLGLKLYLLPRDLRVGVELAVLGDAADLELGGCLHLLVLSPGGLVLLQQAHVYRL